MPDFHNTPAYADEETVDTDFVHHLVRGAELLQAGDAGQARGMLERALKLRPKNQRGQHLLALSYFKLGLFDRAEEIYRALIGEYPNDAALRINLGLVNLKTSRSDDAILAFTSALELTPGHTKAQNYLGLAFLQKGDGDQARTWFERAGNAPMVERLRTAAAAPVRLEQVGETALQVLDARDVPFQPAVETTPVRVPGLWVATRPGEALETPAPALELGAPDLATFSATARVEPLLAAPFAVGERAVAIEVRGEVYARIEGLAATLGALELKPAFKRFRGRITEKPFGDPARRMMHVSGKGRLLVAAGGRRFHAVEIGDEPAFFREDALFAFEESLLFENGRVPSKVGGDLNLVHLRNRGRALVVSRHAPRALDVVKDEPVRVPMDVLLGWHGNVAPRIVPLLDETLAADLPAVATVELTGEGRVLLDAEL